MGYIKRGTVKRIPFHYKSKVLKVVPVLTSLIRNAMTRSKEVKIRCIIDGDFKVTFNR